MYINTHTLIYIFATVDNLKRFSFFGIHGTKLHKREKMFEMLTQNSNYHMNEVNPWRKIHIEMRESPQAR